MAGVGAVERCGRGVEYTRWLYFYRWGLSNVVGHGRDYTLWAWGWPTSAGVGPSACGRCGDKCGTACYANSRFPFLYRG